MRQPVRSPVTSKWVVRSSCPPRAMRTTGVPPGPGWAVSASGVGCLAGERRAGDVEVEALEVHHLAELRRPGPPSAGGAFSPGALTPSVMRSTKSGGSSASRSSDSWRSRSAFSWRQVAAASPVGAPHRSLLSAGSLRDVVAEHGVLGDPLPDQVVGGGGPAAPLGAGAGRGQRLEADLLEHGGGRRRRALHAGHQIHHRAAEEALLLRGPGQVHQRGRDVDVAHGLGHPARGCSPGTRTISGTLVCGAYRS